MNGEWVAVGVLFVLVWTAISAIPGFSGPRGGYGIHSDGQDWGDFSAPFLAAIIVALFVRIIGWELS